MMFVFVILAATAAVLVMVDEGARVHDVRARDPRSHSRSVRHGCEGARVHDVRARDPRSHSRSARHG